MFDEKLNKLPEMNLKDLTTLNYSPNTVNIGSVNFHTNLYMNNTHNKTNPNSSLGYPNYGSSNTSSTSWLESIMNPLTASLTNPSFLSSLSSLSSLTPKTNITTDIDRPLLERSTGVPSWYSSFSSDYTCSSTGPSNYSSTGPSTCSSTGPSTCSSTGPSNYSSTGPSNYSFNSTGTERSSSSVVHDYNVLEHIFILDTDNSNGYKISCSCVSPTGCSQLNTEMSQNENTQEHVNEPVSSETQEKTVTESSVTVENEN